MALLILNAIIFLFHSRSLRLDFERTTINSGVTTVRYTTTPDLLSPIASNECFCPQKTNDDGEDVAQCLQAGVMDMTPCFKGRILLSHPHFLYGDQALLKYPIGLAPQKEKHETFIEFDPVILFSSVIQLGVQYIQGNKGFFETFCALMNRDT